MDINELLRVRQFQAFEVRREAGDVDIFGELVDTGKTCPVCGKEAHKTHQYYQKRVRHLSVFEQPTYLCFTHRLLCCPCGKLFLERLDFIDLNRHYTKPYEDYLYELCRGQSLERVAQREGLSWDQVDGIFKKGGLGQRANPAGQRGGEQPIPIPG